MRIGVDIGGTFNDFVVYRPETKPVGTFKLPSTPLNPAEAIPTERRAHQPYGIENGQPGASGQTLLLRNSEVFTLPGKDTFDLQEGDILSIQTPGGGGYGQPDKE